MKKGGCREASRPSLFAGDPEASVSLDEALVDAIGEDLIPVVPVRDGVLVPAHDHLVEVNFGPIAVRRRPGADVIRQTLDVVVDLGPLFGPGRIGFAECFRVERGLACHGDSPFSGVSTLLGSPNFRIYRNARSD